MKELEYDLVAIGGGTAGLVTGAGAAYLGANAAIVEKTALGGDCLWTGCVPSKALIAAATVAHEMRTAGRWGLVEHAPLHSFGEVMERMRAARATVAHHDDPERFRKMGVDVLEGAARFLEPGLLDVEGVGRVRARRIVIATGAGPAVPPIPGLREAGFLTNESAFDQNELPATIAILGGGPIGLEFAQIYARLGARVTVIERDPDVLPGEDPDVARAIRALLAGEGIRFAVGTSVERVERSSDGKALFAAGGERFEAAEIFVATGRRPGTDGLELERAGVELDHGAVRVDAHLRTSAKGVWAAGDVAGGLQFTHVAEYMAKTVLQNALLPLKKKADFSGVPRVTYTDPEVAHVGLGQGEAEERGGRTFRYDFGDLDRAIADGRTEGFVKITADRKGGIMGATIVGSGAGELIFPLVLARRNGIPLSKIADTIFPYPTRMEGIKRTADLYQRTRLEGAGGRILRKVVSWMT
jgi:pyruvate/2-oxoglutarate dehydrogenase complex dihydrolipoamide dehydrogenase (E3) component